MNSDAVNLERASSRFHLRVRFCETDLMGIVHHSNYLAYFEAARVEYMRRRGVDYSKWAEEFGVHLPVIDAHLEYKRSARFDDELVVEAQVSLITRVRLKFSYTIYRENSGEGEPELICLGFTTLACVGEDLRPRRFPADLNQLLIAAEA